MSNFRSVSCFSVGLIFRPEKDRDGPREDEKGSFFANWTTMRHANLINGETKPKKKVEFQPRS